METESTLSIWIVDDDKMFLESLKHFLQQKLRKPIQIKLFQNGESFLKHISDKKPDIVVLDYILNSMEPYAMDGRYVLQKIKQLYPEVTVIMLSGQNKIEVALQSLKEGAFDYVIKNDMVYFKLISAIKNSLKRISRAKRLRFLSSFISNAALFLVAGIIIVVLIKYIFVG